MTLDLDAPAPGPRARPLGRRAPRAGARRRHRRRAVAAGPGRRRRLTVGRALAAVREAVAELADVSSARRSRRGSCTCPLSWDDPATREAIERYMHGVRADAPWCPWNIEFIRRINGLDTVDDVERIVFDASYLVLGPRRRLPRCARWRPRSTRATGWSPPSTTRRGPGRPRTPSASAAPTCASTAWRARAATSSSGARCRCGTGPRPGPHFEDPWLLRPFDQLRWFPVSRRGAARAAGRAGARRARRATSRRRRSRWPSTSASSTARRDEIEAFRARQQRGVRRRSVGRGPTPGSSRRVTREPTTPTRRGRARPSSASPPTAATGIWIAVVDAGEARRAGRGRRGAGSPRARRCRSPAPPWRSRTTSTWPGCRPPPAARPTPTDPTASAPVRGGPAARPARW